MFFYRIHFGNENTEIIEATDIYEAEKIAEIAAICDGENKKHCWAEEITKKDLTNEEIEIEKQFPVFS
jgi:hypothetical protein